MVKKRVTYGDNVIRIHETPGVGVQGHLAAFFMSAVASIDYTQTPDLRARPRYPRRTKNQLGLPRNLHVLPVKSIARFTNNNGVVSLHDKLRTVERPRPAKPNDLIFCARRAWDKRAETGYMKHIENAFQELAEEIIAGRVSQISSTQKVTVNHFYALWYMRARYKYLDSQETQARGVAGTKRTQDQEDSLENEGLLFAREGGRIPTRQINGLQLQFRIRAYADQTLSVAQWGIIRAQEGQFVVPDVPTYTTIPLTPTLCLISPAPDGMILKENVADLNRGTMAQSHEYFFANDFAMCPF